MHSLRRVTWTLAGGWPRRRPSCGRGPGLPGAASRADLSGPGRTGARARPGAASTPDRAIAIATPTLRLGGRRRPLLAGGRRGRPGRRRAGAADCSRRCCGPIRRATGGQPGRCSISSAASPCAAVMRPAPSISPVRRWRSTRRSDGRLDFPPPTRPAGRWSPGGRPTEAIAEHRRGLQRRWPSGAMAKGWRVWPRRWRPTVSWRRQRRSSAPPARRCASATVAANPAAASHRRHRDDLRDGLGHGVFQAARQRGQRQARPMCSPTRRAGRRASAGRRDRRPGPPAADRWPT